MLQPYPSWHSPHPILAVTHTNRCNGLAQYSLTLDPAHTHADKCFNLAHTGPSQALALVLPSRNCSLTEEFPKFPYQTYSQFWISFLPLGTMTRHSLPLVQASASAVSSQLWFPLSVHEKSVIQPGLALSPSLALVQISRCCSPIEASPQVPYRIRPGAVLWCSSGCYSPALYGPSFPLHSGVGIEA